MAYDPRIAGATALAAVLAACGPSTAKGDKLYEKGDLEGAAAEYREVLEKKDDIVAVVKLGRTQLEMFSGGEDGEVTAEQWKKTYDLLARAREAEPLPPEVDPIKDWELGDAALQTGLALAEDGRHADAVKMLEAAVEHGRDGASVYEALAGSRLESGDEQGAVDAALQAIAKNTRNAGLLREIALLASDLGRGSDCHELMLVAEALEPAGFHYLTHKEIHQLVSRSYYYLTTGLLETVFTTRRMDPSRVEEWKADEALMTKNWEKYQKRPPEEVKKEERPYFLRVLYHLYVAHGMAHLLLCEFDEARTWWQEADAIDESRYEAPDNVDQETVVDELAWPSRNIELLDELTSG
jgi:tetratricopeptide (TPR) repeat protein